MSLDEKFKAAYHIWIKGCIPDSKIEINSNAYLKFLKSLGALETKEEFERVMKKVQIDALNGTDEILLLLYAMNASNTPVNKYLVISNAYLLKNKKLGFNNYDFLEKLHPEEDKLFMLPFSSELEQSICIISQFELIDIKDNKRISLLGKGVKLMKENINAYLMEEQFKNNIAGKMECF